MSNSVTQPTLYLVAAAVGVAGLLAAPAAHADKYSCNVNGSQLHLRVHPDYTYDVFIAADGSTFNGEVHSTVAGQNAAGGHSRGGIAGTTVDFIVDWTTSGGGATHFRGTVGADGIATGTATGSPAKDANGGIQFAPGPWESVAPLTCPGAQGPGPQSQTATVTSDVDVYDRPGGDGTVIGILRSGKTVQLPEDCKKEDWCHVTGDAVPGGNGWVWGALNF